MFRTFVFVAVCVLSSAFAMDPDPWQNGHEERKDAAYGADVASGQEAPALAAAVAAADEEPADDAGQPPARLDLAMEELVNVAEYFELPAQQAAAEIQPPAAAAEYVRVIDSAVGYLGRWDPESAPEEDDEEMVVPQG